MLYSFARGIDTRPFKVCYKNAVYFPRNSCTNMIRIKLTFWFLSSIGKWNQKVNICRNLMGCSIWQWRSSRALPFQHDSRGLPAPFLELVVNCCHSFASECAPLEGKDCPFHSSWWSEQMELEHRTSLWGTEFATQLTDRIISPLIRILLMRFVDSI